jgi:low temperature requirement protein LtrA
MTPSSTVSGILIVTAGFLSTTPRVALWIVALAIDYLGVLFGRGQGWRVSPGHFAERHGLIVIIAIGESIVALGVGAAGLSLGLGVVAAGVLGIVVTAALWWAYFDWTVIVAEDLLGRAQGAARAALARDMYSYLHLPMVAGIVLFALAMKKTLADVDEPLGSVPAAGLCGGLALYLLAYVALGLRVSRRIFRGRLTAAVVLLAVYPAVLELPALGALGLVAAVSTALIAYEAIYHREERLQIRQARAAI